MKLRSFFYALTAGVLVLLLIGASGFYWLTSQSPLTLLRGGSAATPSAAIFVPKQAPVMVSLLVNPDRLEAFRQLLANPGSRQRSRTELNQLKQTLLANTNLDYQRDIQPWIDDELTVAVTTPDIDRDKENGLQPGYLLVATTKNAKKSREFIQLFWQKQALAGTELVYEQYKGVNLIYPNQQSAATADSKVRNLATAMVGARFVALANNPKVLRDAINNVQATSRNLSQSSQYQKFLSNLDSPRIGLTFVNIPAMLSWLGNEQASTAWQQYENLALALGLKPKGILAQTSLIAAPNKDLTAKTPELSKPVGALEYLPESTAIAAAGTNLNQLWFQLKAEPESATTNQLLDQIQTQIQSAWGINLPQDVFSWVQGEYALGLLPNQGRNYPDWIFVAEKSASATESEAIQHLDDIARNQGFSVGSLPLGKGTITGWTKLRTVSDSTQPDKNAIRLEAEVEGVHTTAGKYEIFATSVEAINQALELSRNSLVTSDKFKVAIAPLPAPNDGYLYIDWISLKPILERQVPIFKVVELAGKPLFSHLRAIAVSSYGSNAQTQLGKLFLRLDN